MKILWEDYVWDKYIPLTGLEIEKVESSLNVQFPDDYKSVVIKHQGQTPVQCCFKVNDNYIVVFNTLFHFNDGESKTYNIIKNNNIASEFLPEMIIPFADTAGDDFVCFDYRSGEVKVVFASHERSGEEAIIPIANSFTEFLSMLYEPTD